MKNWGCLLSGLFAVGLGGGAALISYLYEVMPEIITAAAIAGGLLAVGLGVVVLVLARRGSWFDDSGGGRGMDPHKPYSPPPGGIQAGREESRQVIKAVTEYVNQRR